jgi:3-isopropylmalate dehydrogenase
MWLGAVVVTFSLAGLNWKTIGTCHPVYQRLVKPPVFKTNGHQKMTTHSLFLLPGDGIGPEVMGQVENIIAWMNDAGIAKLKTDRGLVGGSAYDAHGQAISDADMAKAEAADAVLFGAVGGPKWDKVPYEARPEAGLLRLRKDLGLFANLRPAICYPALADASSLKRDVVEGLDILIVRELTGGVYFGEPKIIGTRENGEKYAVDTQVYDTYEIERIARVAFDLAATRKSQVASAEKRNVMKSGVLWNEVVTRIHATEYPTQKLEHVLADNCAMQLVRWPKQYDVIVTDNLFGDVLSDVAAMLTGSLGMLPSASLGAPDAKSGRRKALYEPVHGSAPDIAGTGAANPIAMIASFGMCLRYSLGLGLWADNIDTAVASVLARGLRTKDIAAKGEATVDTGTIGAAILSELKAI